MTEVVTTLLADHALTADYAVEESNSSADWQDYLSNPLLTAAKPLLLFLVKLRDIPQPENIIVLRKIIVHTINTFDKQAKHFGCQPKLILASRYCLCTALDEVVLSNAWAVDSEWSQHTLLSLIHRETWGGERFFIILEKMLEQPRENIDLLELIYTILSLGFEGKFYNQDKMAREEVMHRLYQTIARYRDHSPEELSPSLMAIDKSAKPFKPMMGWQWKIPALALGIIFLLAVITNIAIYANTHKTLQALVDAGQMPESVLTAEKNTRIEQANATSHRSIHAKLKHHTRHTYY